MKKKLLALFGLGIPLLLFATMVYAAISVTLAWNASTSPEVTGYKVYWGTTSRTYGPPIDAGLNLQQTISNLPNTGPVYFSATAYSPQAESDFSEELVGWSINATSDTNSTITPSGAKLYGQNTSATFTITANTGYQVVDVKVDGNSIGAVSSYTFSAIAANHTITVVTAVKPKPPTNLRFSQLMLLFNSSIPAGDISKIN